MFGKDEDYPSTMFDDESGYVQCSIMCKCMRRKGSPINRIYWGIDNPLDWMGSNRTSNQPRKNVSASILNSQSFPSPPNG